MQAVQYVLTGLRSDLPRRYQHMPKIALFLTMLVTLGLAGCQAVGQTPAQKAVEQVTGGQVSQSGDSVTIKTGTGESVTFNGQAPDELKAFPVPAGFTLDKDGYGSMTTQDGTMATATWVGSGGVGAAGDFYTGTLPKQGWTQTMAIDSGTSRVFTYDKGEHSAWVSIDDDGGKTRIAVLYGRQTNRPTPTAARAVAAPAATAEARAGTSVDDAASRPQPTATSEAPTLTDPSVLPNELRAIPLASGFGIVKGSAQRIAEGGVFRMATARAFGKLSVTDVESFYKQALVGQWKQDSEFAGEDECQLAYTSKTEDTLALNIDIEKVDAGTEVTLTLLSSD
jgi:hypothetical protein